MPERAVTAVRPRSGAELPECVAFRVMGKAAIVAIFILGVIVGLLGIYVTFGARSSPPTEPQALTPVLAQPSIPPTIARPLAEPPAPATQAPKPGETEPFVLQTGPVTIWTAYEKNEVGADNRFRNRRLRLMARIEGIRKDALDNIVVDLAAGPKPAREDPFKVLAHRTEVIQANFSDEWATTVGALERADVVAVKCTGMGLHMGVPVLGDCSVEWSQPKPLEPFAKQLAWSYEACVADVAIPVIEEALDAGHLPDGGQVSPKARAFVPIAQRMRREDIANLSKAGLEQLNCHHPAMVLIASCNEKDSQQNYPQCDSDLWRAARSNLHD